MRFFAHVRWSVSRRSIAYALLLTWSCTAFPATATAPSGLDLDGHSVQLVPSSASAIVLFFTASDCPISNRYEPEMLRLERKFAPSGVQFWWVYPNPGDTASVIRRHQSQSAGSTHVLRDTQQSLAHIANVSVTPEAAVFISANGTLREIYHGRIDDRYISLGQERPRAHHHELEDAIAEALAKQPVVPPAGPPVGCSIVPLDVARQ
jgi:hypothetical protein